MHRVLGQIQSLEVGPVSRNWLCVRATCGATGRAFSIEGSAPTRWGRASSGLMIHSFARVGAALSMKVDDVFVQKWCLSGYVRQHEAASGMDAVSNNLRPLFRTTEQGAKRTSKRPCPVERVSDFPTPRVRGSYRRRVRQSFVLQPESLSRKWERVVTMANHTVADLRRPGLRSAMVVVLRWRWKKSNRRIYTSTRLNVHMSTCSLTL